MRELPKLTIVDGDLLRQEVEVIVNPWSRNVIPYWLLWPRGVSGVIRRAAGCQPFRELRRHGRLPLGGAALTTAGRLPFRGIIHVASVGLRWTSSEEAVILSVANALALAHGRFISLAFPLIGAGTGGMKPERVEAIMEEAIGTADFEGEVRIVRFKPDAPP